MTTPVSLTIADGLATLTLARPEANNALDWSVIDALAHKVETIDGDAAVRAVLILADGRNFCVGGDIRAFAADADPAALIGKLARRLHEAVLALAELPVPVVIAVQGAAAGAGLSLAAAGDVVLAGRSATFTLAYAGIGLTADGGATWMLPRVIGLRRTQELAFTGRRLTAEDAERYGLVTRVVEDEALTEEALGLARQLAAGPTRAFGAVKRLLAGGDTAPLAAHLDAEADAISAAMRTADARDAIAAFLDRRKPVFSGR